MKKILLLGIPGMWSYDATLLPMLRTLAQSGWEYDALTLRGHVPGRPDKDLGRRSISEYREQVLAELKERTISHRLILVGHSMGGLLTLMAAEAGLAEAAVLLAPAAPKGVSTISVSRPMTRLLLEVSAHQLKGGRNPWGKGFVLSEELFRELLVNGLSPEIQNRVFQNAVPESAKALNENLSAPLVALLSGHPFSTPHPRAVNLSRITCPVFIAVGTEDKITPLSISAAIEAGLTEAPKRLLPVKDACHWLFEEPSWLGGTDKTHQVRDKIVAWISEVTR